ncbi:MAG: hypothetical protein V7731_04245 [Amphritea sp.]
MKMFFSCRIRQLWQTIWSVPALVALVFTLSLTGVASPAFAVNDLGLFELDIRVGVEGDQDKKNDPIPLFVGDGNTTEDNGGDDWETIYLDRLLPQDMWDSDAMVISFVEDTFANNNIDNGAEPFVILRTPEETFFTGGGSKDTNGIQDGPWLYKVSSDVVPDKNDILNAFAALYDDGGVPIVYFGLDTYSVNGSANAGFWFFKQDIGLSPLAAGETTGTFSGEHTDGDFFVAVAYTQGGRVGEIDIYLWVGDDATGSLVLQDSGQDCADFPAGGDDVCGVINKLMPDETFGEDPIFDYANVLVANNPGAATSYQYESAAFVEFGLDLSTLFPEGLGCFSTFLAETRSSQSKTSQLKDFAFGDFDVCSIDVTKTGDTLSKVGDDVDYEIVVTNTGLATLWKLLIEDSVFGDLTDGTNSLITNSDCGDTLDPGDSCTINVTRTVDALDPDPLDNTVTIVYTEFDDELSLSFTDSASHSVELFQPGIIVDKSGTTLSKIGDTVTYDYVITNDSSADTPTLNLVSVLDDGDNNGGLGLGDITATAGANGCSTLASPSGSCSFSIDYTVLAGDDDPLDNEVTVLYNPDGFDNEITDSDVHSVNLYQPGVLVDKSGTTLSKIGDTVTYDYVITNDSSADTPTLNLVSVLDDGDNNGGLGLGDITATAGANGCSTLASPSGSCSFSIDYTVLAGDDDPLDNEVTVLYNPADFDNEITASDDHSVNLFVPALSIIKSCREKVFDDGEISATEPAEWVYSITNNSSADTPNLILDSASDSFGFPDPGPSDLTSIFPASLSPGQNVVVTLDYTPSEGDVPGISNTITVNYHPDGFTNDIEATDDHDCPILPLGPAIIRIEKVTIGGVGTYNWDNTNDSRLGAADPKLPLSIDLTTVIGALPDGDSPFGAPGAGNGFVTTFPLFTVKSAFNDTRTYTLEEDLADLGSNEPDQRFVSLSCAESTASGGLVDITISPSNKASLDVREDSVVYCRWVNEVQGKIIVDKKTMPAGDPQLFDFSVTGGPSGLSDMPQLADATTPYDSGYIIPGSGYGVAEVNYPSGWESKDVTCTGVVPGRITDDDEDPANINVDPAETVTCIFTNAKIPLLTLVKEVDNQFSGERDASEWTLTASGDGGFFGNGSPATGPVATLGPNEVKAGVAYTLEEDQFELYEVKADWSCDGGIFTDTDGVPNTVPHPTIELTYGDDVICTIENKDILVEFCPDPGVTGRPQLLTMKYTGISQYESPPSQGLSGEVFIVNLDLSPNGAPAPSLVDITVTPLPGGDELTFNVPLNGTFSFANFQSGGVAPKTEFVIKSAVNEGNYVIGEVVQLVGFHTSCSSTLKVGDDYGVLTVFGGILNDGTPVNQ